MHTATILGTLLGKSFKKKSTGLLGGLTLLALAFTLQPAAADTNIFYRSTTPFVDTIGGGPIPGKYTLAYGFHDGNTFNAAQFNNPVSMAIDSLNNMYIADMSNSAVRQVTFAGDTNNSVTSTWISNLTQVISVAEDPNDNLYVVTKADSTLRKYNRFKNLIYSYPLPAVTPTALTLDLNGSTNLYISFTNGLLLNLVQSSTGATITGTNTLVATGAFNWRPVGLAMRINGQVLVSDLISNVIYTVNNVTNTTPVRYVGNGAAGWVDGAAGFVSFNQPYGLTVASDGTILVADFGNNAIRMIDTNLNAFTVYGTTSNFWGAQFPAYPGWLDGKPGNSKTNASSRAPINLTLSAGGVLFVVDQKFDVLRDVTGLGLSAYAGGTGGGGSSGGGGSGTNVVTTPPTDPTITPAYGYFPQCQAITVSNDLGVVYYTTDGTDPTTNSFFLPLVGGVGTINWCATTNDLSFLRLRAFNNGLGGNVVAGGSFPTNQIGFTTTTVAGIGATAIIPIVLNLKSNVTLRSLQYRVEVTPQNGNPFPPANVDILSTGTNDFITYAGTGPNTVTNFLFPYANSSNGLGFVVTALANTSGMEAKNYGSPALLSVTIPSTCTEGQSYKLEILYPSGTSDGIQAGVPLVAMASQTLVISNRSYLAGDSAFGGGYNAGEFGNGRLSNADVNNALYAASGIHIPYTFSDVYNSMDVYPQSSSIAGDKFITFLDWQTILFRSEVLDTNAWLRAWSAGGILSSTEIASNYTQGAFAPDSAPIVPPGQVWLSHAAFSSSVITNAIPGNFYALPVIVKVLPGYSLAGYQFRATLEPDGNAPMPGAINYTGAHLPGLSPNDIICTASLGTLPAPLTGSNTLGQITFQIPANATAGQSYTLHFSYVDGAPNLTTQYHLESLPGSVWILGPATRPVPVIPDEWKIKFFGSATNALAADNADPDGDGQSNLQEFLAGTDPTKASSHLQFTHVHAGLGSPRAVALDWLSAPSKNYILQSAPSLDSTNWTTVGTYTGDGNTQESIQNNNSEAAKFYRLRLQP